MKKLVIIASAIVCALGISTASASTVYSPTSAGGHSMYLAGHQYHFESGATFVDNGTTARLAGTALKNGDGFYVELNFTEHTGSAQPKLELSSGNYGTGPGQVDPATWSLWDLVETGPMASSLKGVNGFAGYNYTLESKPFSGDHVFQSGFGANGKNLENGLSGWFRLLEDFAIDFEPTIDPVNGCTSGNRTCDFNVTLETVPLPASALLLIGAIAGLGAIKRSKRAT